MSAKRKPLRWLVESHVKLPSGNVASVKATVEAPDRAGARRRSGRAIEQEIARIFHSGAGAVGASLERTTPVVWYPLAGRVPR